MTIAPAPAAHDFWAVAPALFDQANAIQEVLERVDTVDDVADEVAALADSLPKFADDYAEADPYLTRALHAGTIDALLAVREEDRTQLRVAVERVRQALRDMLDEHPVWRAGTKDAAVWLGRMRLSTDDLAEVFAVSADTVRRWTNPENPQSPSEDHADKVVVVAKIVNHLRHAMTPRGAIQWLLRPHPALDDRRPVDELKDAESYQRLTRLASNARSFVVT
jgi:Mg-chelatase subunit ChlI